MSSMDENLFMTTWSKVKFLYLSLCMFVNDHDGSYAEISLRASSGSIKASTAVSTSSTWPSISRTRCHVVCVFTV